MYDKIWVYKPCMYHILRVSQWWSIFSCYSYRQASWLHFSLIPMIIWGKNLTIRIFLNSRVICDRMLHIDVLQYWFMMNALIFTDTLNPDNLGFINHISEDTYDYISFLCVIQKYKEAKYFINKLHLCEFYFIQP